MQIVSWNVNSIRQRLTHVADYCRAHQPDIIALQEIKCVNEAFPRETFEDLGYNLLIYGQKTFNGVAVFSRVPIDEAIIGLPGFESDPQARYLEIVVGTATGVLRLINIYAPNGNPVADKYAYKTAYMQALHSHIAATLRDDESFALVGDFNIIPDEEDVYDPDAWREDALFLPQSRQMFADLCALGLTDALRAKHKEPGLYTFWDYQQGAFRRNMGLRIDHVLLNATALEQLEDVIIDKDERAREKPSDHVPIRAILGINVR